MGFLNKTRVVIMAHMNELVDKAVDMNSIPVLKQYVRDLEDATATTRHQSAVAAAQVTGLERDLKLAQDDITTDTARAKAFVAQNNEAGARTVAGRIADHQQTVATLTAQIATAKEQSHALDASVEKMRAKHDTILARVRDLESKDSSARALEQATASIKSADAALHQGVDSSVDDLAKRIDSRNDVAREEFARTTAEMDEPEDPLKKQAVDDILAGLKAEPTAA